MGNGLLHREEEYEEDWSEEDQILRGLDRIGFLFIFD